MKIATLIGAIAILSQLFCSEVSAAESLPRYKMVDLGTLEADSSWTLAINENGQVLGIVEDKGTKFPFLWDEKNGLMIIEMTGFSENNLYLNNKGQIAGCRQDKNGTNQVFIWDPKQGFIDVWCLGSESHLAGFNDQKKVIGQAKVQGDNFQHAFLWDAGKAIDLTKELTKQIPNSWRHVNATAINNTGHVAVTAEHPVNINGYQQWRYKSFIWKDGFFYAVWPEKSLESSVEIRAIDDFGNILVEVNDYPSKHYCWFVSQTGGFKAYLLGWADRIVNQMPTNLESLPGKLKRDAEGNYYYGYGVDPRRLFNIKEPFYNHEVCIRAQNSKGWFVGSAETLSRTQNAFLAIPEKQP
ncbi:MAG: hypothetical protein LLG04_01235 [Parachlamydia sp.]|nr:hypothetical protein [Parachlamydia sp.]